MAKNDPIKVVAGLAIFGGILLLPVLIAGSALLNGFVLMILWRWFFVSAFSLPELSLPAAIGIALTISFVAFKGTEKTENRPLSQSILLLVLNALYALGVGAVVRMFL